MYKIAATISVVSMLVAANYIRASESSGLFAIAWIGGVSYAAVIAASKSYLGRGS